MSELRQNTLEDATTESSFLTTINENAGETVVSLQREVELEDGEIVTVEGITPDKMKAILNNGVEPEAVTFKTPGEYYNEEVKGVVRAYNESTEAPADSQILKRGVEYTLKVKSTGINEDLLKSFGYGVSNRGVVSLCVSDYTNQTYPYNNVELFRLGVTLDDEGKFPSLGFNWNQYATECVGYVYDDMYEAIKEKIVTEEDNTVTDTTSYEGPGWYNFKVIDGSIADVTSLKLTISKYENIPTYENMIFTGLTYFFFEEDLPELPENPDLTGLFDICEEISPEVSDDADAIITIANPVSTSGGQLSIEWNNYSGYLNEKLTDGCKVALRQTGNKVVYGTAVEDEEYEKVFAVVDENEDTIFEVEATEGNSALISRLNTIDGLNVNDSPVN